MPLNYYCRVCCRVYTDELVSIVPLADKIETFISAKIKINGPFKAQSQWKVG